MNLWDEIPPVITDVQATPSAQKPGEPVNITCTVTDNRDLVDTVKVNITGPGGFTLEVAMNKDEGNGYYYEDTYTTLGIYYYYIWANDASRNNVTSDVYHFRISEDIDPPEISDVTLITSDPIDTEPGFGWENFSCTVTDNTAVDEVKLVLIGDTTTEYPMIKDGDDYYCNITIATADEYTYHIWANDTIGNQNTSSPQPFNLPPNEDVDMNGQAYFEDLIAIVMMYGDTGSGGWVREDVDNDGQAYFGDLIAVVMHYGERWRT